MAAWGSCRVTPALPVAPPGLPADPDPEEPDPEEVRSGRKPLRLISLLASDCTSSCVWMCWKGWACGQDCGVGVGLQSGTVHRVGDAVADWLQRGRVSEAVANMLVILYAMHASRGPQPCKSIAYHRRMRRGVLSAQAHGTCPLGVSIFPLQLPAPRPEVRALVLLAWNSAMRCGRSAKDLLTSDTKSMTASPSLRFSVMARARP